MLVLDAAEFQLDVLQGGFVAPEIAIGVLMRLDALAGGAFARGQRAGGRQFQLRLGLLERLQPLCNFGLLRGERVRLSAPVGVAQEQRRTFRGGAFQPPEILESAPPRQARRPPMPPTFAAASFRRRAMAQGQRGESRDGVRLPALGEIESGDAFGLGRLSIGEIVGFARARLFQLDVGQPGLKRAVRDRGPARAEIARLDLAPGAVALLPRGEQWPRSRACRRRSLRRAMSAPALSRSSVLVAIASRSRPRSASTAPRRSISDWISAASGQANA